MNKSKVEREGVSVKQWNRVCVMLRSLYAMTKIPR